MELIGIRATQCLATFAFASQSLGCKCGAGSFVSSDAFTNIHVFDIKSTVTGPYLLLDCNFYLQMLTIPAHQVLQPMVLHWHPRRIPVYLDARDIQSRTTLPGMYMEQRPAAGRSVAAGLGWAWHPCGKPWNPQGFTSCCSTQRISNAVVWPWILTNVTTKLPFLQFQGWLQYQLDHLHIVDDTGLMGAGSALAGNLVKVWQIWSKHQIEKLMDATFEITQFPASSFELSTPDVFCWSCMGFAWECIKSKIRVSSQPAYLLLCKPFQHLDLCPSICL